MSRRISEAPLVTATDETTSAPVTHQGGDGRVSLAPATTTTAGLMPALAMAQLAGLVGSIDLGGWSFASDVQTSGVSLAIVDQAGNAAFVVESDGTVLVGGA